MCVDRLQVPRVSLVGNELSLRAQPRPQLWTSAFKGKAAHRFTGISCSLWGPGSAAIMSTPQSGSTGKSFFPATALRWPGGRVGGFSLQGHPSDPSFFYWLLHHPLRGGPVAVTHAAGRIHMAAPPFRFPPISHHLSHSRTQLREAGRCARQLGHT